MDPLGEVALHATVSDLNQGLPADTISHTPKQPLASHQILTDAAELHALDMLANNYFEHENLTKNRLPTEPLRWDTARVAWART